jgi:hypothetical protein
MGAAWRKTAGLQHLVWHTHVDTIYYFLYTDKADQTAYIEDRTMYLLKGNAMNKLQRSLLIAGMAALAAGSAWAGPGATVTFVQPEQFADMPWAARDREDVLKQLEAHFNKLAEKLPQGTELKVEVLDLDLAGRIRPAFRGHYDLRILGNGADWPHMQVRYTLEREGKVIASGEDHLSNMAYMDRINRYSSGDSLRYEKQMMDDWFKQKLAVR